MIIARRLVALPIRRLRLRHRHFLRRFISIFFLQGFYLRGRGIPVFGNHGRFLGRRRLAIAALAIHEVHDGVAGRGKQGDGRDDTQAFKERLPALRIIVRGWCYLTLRRGSTRRRPRRRMNGGGLGDIGKHLSRCRGRGLRGLLVGRNGLGLRWALAQAYIGYRDRKFIAIGIAGIGILAQRDTNELARRGANRGRQRFRLLINVGKSNGHGGIARKGALAAEHLVTHDAERIDIRGRGDLLALRLLRRNVLGGTYHHAGARERYRGSRLGDAKVRNLYLPILGNHQVAGLNIAVHQAHPVDYG